jgi:hypothetical protein
MVLNVSAASGSKVSNTQGGRRSSNNHRPSGVLGNVSRGPAPFNADDDDTPISLDPNHFKWWADDAASNLKLAVDNSSIREERDDPLPSGIEDPEVSKVTRKICSQLAKQIPSSAYDEVTLSLRQKMKTLERACQSTIRESRSLVDSPISDEQSDIIAGKMESVIMRRMPEEITRWLAKEIHSPLVKDALADDNEFDDNYFFEGFGTTGFPESESDTQLSRWSNNTKSSASVTPDDSVHQNTMFSDRQLPSGKSVSSSTEHSRVTSKSKVTYEGDDRDEFHRKFYNDNFDAKLQLEAFKKFLMVLVSGRGFRVVKHNHGGGRNTRILKYNSSKNRIFWESSKFLGGEYIDCRTITRVDREENVVYVWHTTGRNTKKKMVGLETQREYDARVLQLALLHLYNQYPHIV